MLLVKENNNISIFSFSHVLNLFRHDAKKTSYVQLKYTNLETSYYLRGIIKCQ